MMHNTNYISHIFFLAALVALLPACNPPKQKPAVTHKKQTAESGPLSEQTYKEKKATIRHKLSIKKKMRDELPARIKDMNEKQLIQGKTYCLELGYIDLAIKHLDRLIIITQDTNALKQYRLELADLYFEMGEFEKAGKLYSQYLAYYPGSDKREYVEYKAILCRFYDTLSVDRDQSKTKETLALAHNYLEKKDIYSTYLHDVEQIQHTSYEKLVQSEAEIVQFYMRRNKFVSAEQRLAHIKENYLKYVQDYEPNVLNLEIKLADAQGLTEKAQEKRTELALRFPKNDTVLLAQKTKTDYVTKF